MELWSKLHILTIVPTFIVAPILAFLIGKWSKNKDEKTKLVPLKILAVTIVIMEIFKQIVSLNEGYSLFHIPLHYCSLFIFLLPLSVYYKGKYKNNVKIFTLSCCMALFFVMLLIPNSIYQSVNIEEMFTDFLSFHTVVFHSIVIFYFALMLVLCDFNFNSKSDIKNISVIMTCYLSVSAIASQILKTNYHGMYYCIVDPINNLRLLLVEKIDWIGQLIYVILVIIVSCIVTILGYYLVKITLKYLERLKNSKS